MLFEAFSWGVLAGIAITGSTIWAADRFWEWVDLGT
jgi:hypothetical protein